MDSHYQILPPPTYKHYTPRPSREDDPKRAAFIESLIRKQREQQEDEQ